MALVVARHACFLAALGLLTALVFVPQTARAAVTEAWVQRYSNLQSNSDDSAVKVMRDAVGDIIVAGSTREGVLAVKYSGVDGSVLWEKRGPVGRASAGAVDGSGNVVVTGTSFNGGNQGDYYTAKYAAAAGALLWAKRYNGPANGADEASAVAVDASGSVVVSGSSWNGSNYDCYTAKYAAADGALLWEQRYNGPANGADQATAVAVDACGNVVVTGSSESGPYNPDYYTAKYAAADGALLWEKRYNGPGDSDDKAAAVAVDGSGNVLVTGYSYNNSFNSGGNADYYTAKYAAADGALLWEKRYDGPGNSWDGAQAVAVDNSGNVVVTGGSGAVTNGSLVTDYYTAKYAAANGALLWEKRYNGPAKATAVGVDSSGNVVVTGSSSNGTNGYDGYYTAKYAAADGALLWEKRYNGPGNDWDVANAVAVDASGNVVVTGNSYGSGSGLDAYTAKYGATNGALLWEQRYNGPPYNNDHGRAIAVDGSGNVLVTGNSVSGSSYTAKYAAANGALLWEKYWLIASALAMDASGNVALAGFSYSGDAGGPPVADFYTAKFAAADGALLWEKHGNGGGVAVAIDGSGNVVVTGYSHNGTNYYRDYYTAKHAAADGALLWEKRYNGPANSDGFAVAVAVDNSGNAIVTGSSNNGTNNDYYTAKYAATDGALLWAQRYNGPANRDDSAKALAVDGNGNVVVTGNSGNGTNADYYTAKYAAGDGALLWEQRYNGPAKGNDFVGGSRSLALGPNGMVAITGSSEGSFGYDYATIVYRENLPPVSIARVPTGVHIRFTGVPGRSYNIERALVVTGPWSTIATPTAPLDGLIEYTDTNPPMSGAFYRTSEPTP